MGFFNSLDIAASGLTAQKMRIDILAQNLVHSETTRTADGTPYRRKMVVFQERPNSDFAGHLRIAQNSPGGVQVAAIVEDDRELKPIYDPTHPDAGADGYVMMPNVNKIKEMSDMLSATRAYEANITAVNAMKLIAGKALEIGK